jgi:hypothetical protein
MNPKFLDRFWSKVNKTENCWLWTGSKYKEGYGLIWDKPKIGRAHRISYELAYGPIPEGLCIAHKCDTPSCVNPDHLFAATHAENMRDRDNKGRHAKGDRHGTKRQPHSIHRGTMCRQHKLDEAQIIEIRQRADSGESMCSLSRRFNVSRRNIQFIAKRLSWRHIA